MTEPASSDDLDPDDSDALGRRLARTRSEDLDLARAPLRPDAAARAHDPADQVERRTHGLSTFLVDMKRAQADGTMTIRPIRTLMNHATTEIWLDGVFVPDEDLVGEEGLGFRYILDGMNAERVLIAAECIGDGHWFVRKAAAYASERVVFGRPIGANQGVQFPIAQAHAQIEAADLMRYKAAWLFEQGLPCGAGEHGQAARRRGVAAGRPTPASTRTVASASPRSTTSSGSSARRACTRWLRSRTT